MLKKLLRYGGLVFLLLCLLLGDMSISAAPPRDGQDYAADHMLVKFKPDIVDAASIALHQEHGNAIIGEIDKLGIQIVEIPPGTLEQNLNLYRRNTLVEFAEPDYIARACFEPDDPGFYQQWGMTRIQAQQAWDVTRGSTDITIAILDSGIDQDHEDLAGKIEWNINFSTTYTYDDYYGHGTHVAGIAAAVTNNGLGVAGLGYNCRILNVKVLDDSGLGRYSDIADGIMWAADNGAKVINMSFSGENYSSTLESAVDYAWSEGAVLVAAAGNDDVNRPAYPASLARCIAVAATDQNDDKASFSNYGNWVDVAAPGVDVYSTMPNHPNDDGTLNYGDKRGTSMASPHVGGLAALIWSTSYGTSNSAVRSRIEATAEPIQGTGTLWQYGLINASAAMPPTASLGDLVWEDIDGNGIQNLGEQGIEGVPVNLYQSDDSLVASTASGSDGHYSFDNLYPGDYYLEFVPPEGYLFTLENQGTDDTIDSDASVSTGKTSMVTLAIGQSDPDWDAGLIQSASLGDLVWEDTDGNGIQNNAVQTTVALVEGWNTFSTPVTLDEASDTWGELFNLNGLGELAGRVYTYQDGVWAPVTDPDAVIEPLDGYFIKLDENSSPVPVDIVPHPEFPVPSPRQLDQGANLIGPASASFEDEAAVSLLTSIYQTAEGRQGYSLVISPSANQDDWGVYYRATPEPSTSAQTMKAGRAYWVIMENPGPYWGKGVWGEEGIAGVTVNLYRGDDSFVASTATGSDGEYSFDNLYPGDYYLEFVPPDGYRFTLENQGTDDTVDSDASAATGKTSTITLSYGQSDPDWDAGLYQEL
jgi:thermitase